MSPASKTPWIIAASLLAVLLGGWLWSLWSGYGEISPAGYQHAMALISVCNRQDADRLQQLVASLHRAEQTEELPPYDVRILLRIARRAAEGDWVWSSREARRLMMAQIE